MSSILPISNANLTKPTAPIGTKLSNELGDEIGSYSQLFKTAEEIEQEIADIKNALFDFDTENAEEFCSQISQIEDKKQLLALKKSPANRQRVVQHPAPARQPRIFCASGF